MIFGGIQKTSLIDFTSKISCVLFTAGCNFTCPYCHNPELVNPPFISIAEEEILAFLEKRKSLLDGVVITGGEPTLQKDLLDFCKRVKSMGFPIKLDTNGSRPNVLRDLIKGRVIDYIAMDIKALPHQYIPDLSQNISSDIILESIHLILDSKLPHEFRTTCVRPFIDSDIILQIAKIIEGTDLYVLQHATISDAVLHPEFFQNRDGQIKPSEVSAFQALAAPYVKNTLVR